MTSKAQCMKLQRVPKVIPSNSLPRKGKKENLAARIQTCARTTRVGLLVPPVEDRLAPVPSITRGLWDRGLDRHIGESVCGWNFVLGENELKIRWSGVRTVTMCWLFLQLGDDSDEAADMQNAGLPPSDTPSATNYFLQYISSR